MTPRPREGRGGEGWVEERKRKWRRGGEEWDGTMRVIRMGKKRRASVEQRRNEEERIGYTIG